MHTMNVSMWLDKVGAAFVSTVLIAALPTALSSFCSKASDLAFFDQESFDDLYEDRDV